MPGKGKSGTGTMTVREAGRKGGRATKAKAANDPGFYPRIGKKGGETTRARHAHMFSKWGRKGGKELRRLVAIGRRSQRQQ